MICFVTLILSHVVRIIFTLLQNSCLVARDSRFPQQKFSSYVQYKADKLDNARQKKSPNLDNDVCVCDARLLFSGFFGYLVIYPSILLSILLLFVLISVFDLDLISPKSLLMHHHSLFPFPFPFPFLFIFLFIWHFLSLNFSFSLSVSFSLSAI